MTFKFSIDNLPNEVIVMVFNHLPIEDLQSCSQTCTKWRKLAVHFFFRPQLCILAKFDELMKNTFYEEKWTEDCKDDDLIMELYEKYKFSIEVSVTIPKTPNTRNISDVRRLIRMLFSQNRLKGECFYPRICDVTKHAFVLEFGASPELGTYKLNVRYIFIVSNER